MTQTTFDAHPRSSLIVALDFDSLSSAVKLDRKSTRLNSSHGYISYAVFCLKINQVDLPRNLVVSLPRDLHGTSVQAIVRVGGALRQRLLRKRLLIAPVRSECVSDTTSVSGA